MTRRTRRVLLALLIFAISAIAGGSLYLYGILRASLPPLSGNVATGVPDLAPVEILYDSLGVPQVLAQNRADALFALGWLHASDRLFQMELLRRISQGRLAEILGESVLELDREARQIGHHRLAEKWRDSLAPTNEKLLGAYCNGVNAYISLGRSLPFEFHLLGIPFGKWTPTDCLTLMSFQTWFSNSLQNRDGWFLELALKYGDSAVSPYFTGSADWMPATVTGDESPALGYEPWSPRQALARHLTTLHAEAQGGSNAWAVAPRRSSTGSALFACDPHLPIDRLPQFWYLSGLHARDDSLSIIGVSLPGLPFVVMGHNTSIAFGFTVGGIDLIDYYRLETDSLDPTKYRTASGWKDLEIVIDTIAVRGKSEGDLLRTARSDFGPLVARDTLTDRWIALKWAGADADLGRAVEAAFSLWEIDDFSQFRVMATSLAALDANWVYADAHGNIGYQLGTPVPRRQRTHTNAPLDATDSLSAWRGYWTPDERPHVLNPAAGWVASCNNIPDGRFRDSIPGTFAADRILRIRTLLNAHPAVTADDFRSFQLDETDEYLLRWRELVAGAFRKTGELELADSIAGWDGSSRSESSTIGILSLFVAELRIALFGETIGDAGSGVRTLWLDHMYLGVPELHRDTEMSARMDSALVVAARNTAVLWNGESWGEVHTLTMEHPFDRIPLLGSILGLSRGPFQRGGSSGSLNAAIFRRTSPEKFRTLVGASFRCVVDFRSLDSTTMEIPAGNSGNPVSTHFFDFFPLWNSGNRWIVPSTEGAVRTRGMRTVRLIGSVGQ